MRAGSGEYRILPTVGAPKEYDLLYPPILSENIPMYSAPYALMTVSHVSYFPYADTAAMKMFLQECSWTFKDYRALLVMTSCMATAPRHWNIWRIFRIIYQPSYSPGNESRRTSLGIWYGKNYLTKLHWSTMATEQSLETDPETIMECRWTDPEYRRIMGYF